MITAFVEMRIRPEMEKIFIKSLDTVKCALEHAEGCNGFILHRSLEDRAHYILRIEWENVAFGTEMFHKTSAYRVMMDEVSSNVCWQLDPWYTETVAAIGRFRRFNALDTLGGRINSF
jgi:quinol monooxygenase YgiN